MDATSEPTSNTAEALLAAHGPAIGAFAYLVLQQQADAERILAATLATALGRADLPTDAEVARAALLRIAAREILRGSSQTGEVTPLLPDPRSASDRMSILEGLAEVDPRSRMALVLHYFLEMRPDAVAAILDDDAFALRSDLNEARNRLQSRVEELQATEGTYPSDVPTQAGPLEPFDARLRRTLVEESGRFEPVLDPRGLRNAAPSPGHVGLRKGWPFALFAFIALLIGGVAAFLWLVPESAPTAGRLAASTTGPTASSRTAEAPITLADCQITPVESPLAFAGWTTLAALDVHGGDAGPGQPIYALVTRGMAEWIGWQEHYSGPMFPAPIGRMGCIFDPSTRQTSLVGVDADWAPKLMGDGCPPSPIDEFGGYRETGGPRAWLLLSRDTASWYVGDFSYLMLFRLSPPAEAGQSITAWAQPLADVRPISGEIDSSSSQLGHPDTSGGGSRYYFVNVRFTTTGCWVINIAINGEVVGSAIAPIGGISGQATPRPAPTVP
jgi:DNA-directed RNA polymerase specialized sigma24 family protein